MYKIIRCGYGFNSVIFVSPVNAKLGDSNAKFYFVSVEFEMECKEISREDALQYFSGQADFLGFENIPEKIFPSIEETLKWVKEMRDVWVRKKIESAGINNDDGWEKLLQELRELLLEFESKRK